MSIVVRFPAARITKQQYDTAHNALVEGGHWPTEGCRMHLAYGDPSDILVIEVWDSMEQLEAYGAVLAPIFEAAGIELSGAPEISEVHDIEAFLDAA